MSLLRRALSGKLTRIRDGEATEISGSINGNSLTAQVDEDLRHGDLVRDKRGELFKVESCQRFESPTGNLDHMEAKVTPLGEWEAAQAAQQPHTVITQHVASAHAVAGRDIGQLTINVSPEQLAAKLQEFIMSLPLAEAEKKGIWSKLGGAILNVGTAAATAFVAGLVAPSK